MVSGFGRDLRRRFDGQPEIGAVDHGRGALKVRGRDTDNGAGLSVDSQRLAENVRMGAPEAIADDDNRAALVELKEAPRLWNHAERGKV